MAEQAALRIMTYNLRHATDPSPNSWEERLPLISGLLQKESPDLIGTQECYYRQIIDMLSILPGYDWLGLGRKGGSNGEFMAIFYKKDRFDVLEYDHYWLSETPNVIGSTTWGNKAPRMTTWGRFKDKQTGATFYLCNTHMDHQSPEARLKGAQLMVRKAEELDPSLPLIITGDFNVGPESEPYEAFSGVGGFLDTWQTARERTQEGLGSFNNFKEPLGRGAAGRIDWILTRGEVETDRIRIVDDHDGSRFPSDHYPVVADVRLAITKEGESV